MITFITNLTIVLIGNILLGLAASYIKNKPLAMISLPDLARLDIIYFVLTLNHVILLMVSLRDFYGPVPIWVGNVVIYSLLMSIYAIVIQATLCQMFLHIYIHHGSLASELNEDQTRWIARLVSISLAAIGLFVDYCTVRIGQGVVFNTLVNGVIVNSPIRYGPFILTAISILFLTSTLLQVKLEIDSFKSNDMDEGLIKNLQKIACSKKVFPVHDTEEHVENGLSMKTMRSMSIMVVIVFFASLFVLFGKSMLQPDSDPLFKFVLVCGLGGIIYPLALMYQTPRHCEYAKKVVLSRLAPIRNV